MATELHYSTLRNVEHIGGRCTFDTEGQKLSKNVKNVNFLQEKVNFLQENVIFLQENLNFLQENPIFFTGKCEFSIGKIFLNTFKLMCNFASKLQILLSGHTSE